MGRNGRKPVRGNKPLGNGAGRRSGPRRPEWMTKPEMGEGAKSVMCARRFDRYVSIPAELGAHTSIIRISRETGLNRAEVIGWLYWLMEYAARHGRDGFLEGFTVQDLCNCIGNTIDFWRVLMQHDWLSEATGGLQVSGCPTSLKRHRDGLVYFIAARQSGMVKIGFTSKTAQERLAGLQTGSSETLEVLATIPGSTKDESELHRRFSALRITGEWFKLEGALRSFIRSIGGQA